MVPVAAVAGETRRLDAEDRADRARRRRRRPASGTRAAPASPEPERPRSSSMIVTDAKPIGARRVGERILAPLALGVAEHLRHGRLADIDDGTAAEVVSRDLRCITASRPSVIVFHGCSPSASSSRSASACTSPSGGRLRWRGLSARTRDRARVVSGSACHRRPPRRPGTSMIGRCARSRRAGHREQPGVRSAPRCAICGGPAEIAAHAAASHIHAGISRDSPAWTSR